jgi:hypothetical protein
MEQTVALWLALAMSVTWLVWFLRRVQLQWDTGEQQIMQRNFEKMELETKRAKEQAKSALKDAQTLRQQRQNAAPPPPIEILVAAEFPSSASEDPWIANMIKRLGAATVDGKPATTPVLFWAAGYPAAQARAKHIAADIQLSVNDIRKLAGAKE